MKDVEFYIFNKELWCISNGVNKLITEQETELVGMILQKIMTLYPNAYKALAEEYKRSASNVPYYQYLMVRRFCKCNFGTLDNTKRDIDIQGNFNFECVSCPLRGECINEGVICNPKLNTKLSDAEMRVMKLLYEGNSPSDIASILYLSPDTVKSHYKTSYKKLGIRNGLTEFVKYASTHNLFD